MPVYFGPVAPSCPISRDEPTPSMAPQRINTTIPFSFDLNSAIAAANRAMHIFSALMVNRTVNNVYQRKQGNPPPPQKDKYKLTHPRWSEQVGKRAFGYYKYYAKNDDGSQNTDLWVVTQRIEQMVWYDSAWRSYLVWTYGDKGDDGVRVRGIYGQ